MTGDPPLWASEKPGRPTARPRGRRRQFIAPTGVMHYKGTKQSTSGAACGATGVRFTGRPEDVECPECRRHLPRRRKRPRA